jgi:hypothetical protein
MKKLSLEEFLVQPHDIPKWDSDSLKELMGRNFIYQMMDVWGEADKAVQTHQTKNTEAILKQLSNLHDVCNIVYINDDISDDVKWELKVAEWEIFDYCLWDNEFQNDSASIMRWFDQWCYDVNFEVSFAT